MERLPGVREETTTSKQEDAGKMSRACDHRSWKEEFLQKAAAQKVECPRTADRCLGISGSRKGKAAGRFHFRGVMLLHKNSSASGVPNN